MDSRFKTMHVNPVPKAVKFVQHQNALPAWMIGTRLPIILALDVLKSARHVQETKTIVILAIQGLRPALWLEEVRLA